MYKCNLEKELNAKKRSVAITKKVLCTMLFFIFVFGTQTLFASIVPVPGPPEFIAELEITNDNLIATFTLEGDITGEISVNNLQFDDVLTVLINQDTGVVTITGTPCNYERVVGKGWIILTRNGVDEIIFVSVDLSPSPSTLFETVSNDPIVVFVNGTEIISPVPARIINDRTMLPLRVIAEALDAEIDWCEDTRTITVDSGIYIAILTIDSKFVEVSFSGADFVTHEIDSPATIVYPGYTLVPVRFFADLFYSDVEWVEGDTQNFVMITQG